MKRLNNSTAADTNAGQPGDDNGRTPGNVAGDHVGTPSDNTKDVLQALPLDASQAPALPNYARLTDAQIAAAHQTGQWLDAFVAFASIASPLTPAAFHLAAGVFLGSFRRRPAPLSFVRGLRYRTTRDRTTLPLGSHPPTARRTEWIMQQKAPITTIGAILL